MEQSKNWQELCLTDVRKYVSDSMAAFQSMIPEIYSKDTSDRQEEYDVTYSGVGNFKKLNGTANKDTMQEEYKTTFDFPQYTNEIDIEKKLWDDRRDRSVMNMATEFGLSLKRTQEEHAAEPFNLAFTSTGIYSSGNSTAGSDTVALCSASHTSKADAGYLGNNLSTTAFSPTAAEQDRRDFMAITDGRGNKVRARMDMLLSPVALEESMYEFINSKNKVDTADNNVNFHNGRYKLAVWEELTDSTNWFSLDSKRMKQALWWITRQPFEDWKEFNNSLQILTYGGVTRYGLNFNSWRWILGHNVSA